MDTILLQTGGKPEETLKEIERSSGPQPRTRKSRFRGTFVKAARYKLIAEPADGQARLTAVNEFIKLAPKDPRGGDLLGYRPHS